MQKCKNVTDTGTESTCVEYNTGTECNNTTETALTLVSSFVVSSEGSQVDNDKLE